jgi:hypothetical protein
MALPLLGPRPALAPVPLPLCQQLKLFSRLLYLYCKSAQTLL